MLFWECMNTISSGLTQSISKDHVNRPAAKSCSDLRQAFTSIWQLLCKAIRFYWRSLTAVELVSARSGSESSLSQTLCRPNMPMLCHVIVSYMHIAAENMNFQQYIVFTGFTKYLLNEQSVKTHKHFWIYCCISTRIWATQSSELQNVLTSVCQS